jgi:chorismate synthase
VVAGALAKLLLKQIGVEIVSHVVSLGSVSSDAVKRPQPGDSDRIDESPVRCFDKATEEKMITEIEAAAKDGDSLGGVVEVLTYGLPVGLGSHVHWDRKIDGMLAQAVMSIQAVKGVEIGDGFSGAALRGSEAHDAISWDESTSSYKRESAKAGGTEGGMTTGEMLVVRAAMKPLSTLNRPTLKTVDVVSKEETVSFKERTDVTAVPAMGVVAETMIALVLAAEAQRKFGGDSVKEFVRNAGAFAESLR